MTVNVILNRPLHLKVRAPNEKHLKVALGEVNGRRALQDASNDIIHLVTELQNLETYNAALLDFHQLVIQPI